VDFAPCIRFSTDAVPTHGRLDHWRTLYGDFAEVEVEPEHRSAFTAYAETWRLGQFTVTEATASGMRFLRRASHCAMRDGDLWVFRLSRGPTWSVVRDELAERVAPGRLWMARTSRPSLTLVPAGRYVLLILPADASCELTAGLSRLAGGVLPGPGAAMLADLVAALPGRLRTTPEAELGLLAESFRTLFATCLLGDLPPVAMRRIVDGSVQRERVLEVIREHIGSARLNVGRICRLADVSRSKLYRMLEGDGGVAALVRDMRLDLALADLRNPALAGIPISEIAERRGLHSAPSFSRAFRRAFGCSPSEARAGAALGFRTLAAVAPASSSRPSADPLGRLRLGLRANEPSPEAAPSKEPLASPAAMNG
jgi:AraC-like DNA-binding protein